LVIIKLIGMPKGKGKKEGAANKWKATAEEIKQEDKTQTEEVLET